MPSSIMLDANIKAQLQSYFTKLRRPIVLKAALDGSQDATKDFTYTKADCVSWETTAMGTTTMVKTAKQ